MGRPDDRGIGLCRRDFGRNGTPSVHSVDPALGGFDAAGCKMGPGIRLPSRASSLQLIRAFAREAHEQFRFRHVSDRVRRRLLKLDLLWSIPAPISEISITIFIAMLIIFVDSSGMGLATLAAFLSLLYRLQGPTRELQQSKIALNGLTGTIDDVGDFLHATNEVFLTNGNLLSQRPPVSVAAR